VTRYRALALFPSPGARHSCWGTRYSTGPRRIRSSSGRKWSWRRPWPWWCRRCCLGFERGDYLRRAWLLIAGCMALLLLRDATLLPLGFDAMGEGRSPVCGGSSSSGNSPRSREPGCWPGPGGGPHSLSGLPRLPGAPGGLVVAVVLAVTGPGMLRNAALVGRGDVAALTGFARPSATPSRSS